MKGRNYQLPEVGFLAKLGQMTNNKPLRKTINKLTILSETIYLNKSDVFQNSLEA